MSEQTATSRNTTHHIVSPKVYLTCRSRAAGGHGANRLGLVLSNSGIWNPVVALAIAGAKAMLVVLFFMHVKYSTKLTKLTVISGIFIFLGLISMTMADYMSRAWGRW